MIKNLIVSGCSFTQQLGWGQEIVDTAKEKFECDLNYVNLAIPGAGNYYIADSMAHYLMSNNLDPAETLVMIMWSGPNRKDITVSSEYYDIVNPSNMAIKQGDIRYVISGGEVGSWQAEIMFPRGSTYSWFLRPIFENLYKCSDWASMSHDTLSNIIRTKDFLESRKYNYRFMSYVNYWGSGPDYVSDNLDFNIPHAVPNHPYLNNLGDNWIWTDSNKNGVYEYTKKLNMFQEMDNLHPTREAHQKFTQEFIIPSIQGLFL